MLSIVFAVVFLVGLSWIKNGIPFKNTAKYQAEGQNGLAYSNATIEDLVAKDADGDGVADWEETLFGLDSTKKETTPGTPDGTVVAKLKADNGGDSISIYDAESEEKLTETDKFSRELFSTIAALNQGGEVTEETVSRIGDSLAERIGNAPVRKIYTFSDIKVTKDDSATSLKNYSESLSKIYASHQNDYSAMEVLQKFIVDDHNVDPSVLGELDPIIGQLNKILADMLKMGVPNSLALLHLELINNTEKVAENLSDIQLYETDSIIALSGISNYDKNTVALETTLRNLAATIDQKSY